MGGGLLQLVAYGAQDVYLTGTPQITFFKVVYRRHTNFSLESIEQTFNGTVGFGRRVTCTVSRNGDLVHKMFLQVKLPNLAITSGTGTQAGWVENVGYKLIKYVEVEIGGQRIDKHYGEWLYIWNELTQCAGHALGLNLMTGNHPSFRKSTVAAAAGGLDVPTMYIPLQFWFNRNPGLALPLIALQYHEVKINFEFEALAALVDIGDAGGLNELTIGDLQAGLYVDYVYLDTDERRRFSQVSHEYLIEQLQYTGSESIPTTGSTAGSTTSHKSKLSFNHPVKELVWVVRDGAAVATDPFNFSVGTSSASAMGGALAGPGGQDAFAALSYGAKNPVKEAILQLNGHDRFSKRDGSYFGLVQPLSHHTNIPPVGINVYSFALKPEEHQPSGTCNFSRIDNATLQLTLESALVDGTTLSVYATNYNVLRILSGMGGLAYASLYGYGLMGGQVTGFATKMVNFVFSGFAHAFGR